MSDHRADWYPDPVHRHELRYWDGTTWTDHVSDRGVTGTDPVDASRGAPKVSRLDRLDASMTLTDEGKPETINTQLAGTGRRGIGLTGPVAGGGALSIDTALKQDSRGLG
jgi:hypothetical protein